MYLCFLSSLGIFLDTTSSNPPSTSVVWDGSVCLSVCSRGPCGSLFLFLRRHNSHSSVISLSAYSNTPLSPARPVSFGCHSFQLWKFLCCCSHLVQTCSWPSVHSPQLSWHLKALSLKASCRSVTRHFCSGLLVHAGFFLWKYPTFCCLCVSCELFIDKLSLFLGAVCSCYCWLLFIFAAGFRPRASLGYERSSLFWRNLSFSWA